MSSTGSLFIIQCNNSRLLDNNFFIPYLTKLNIGDKLDWLIGKLNVKMAWFPNGECSSMAECTTVARETRVQFSPFALKRQRQNRISLNEQICGFAWRVQFSPFALADVFQFITERTTRLLEAK